MRLAEERAVFGLTGMNVQHPEQVIDGEVRPVGNYVQLYLRAKVGEVVKEFPGYRFMNTDAARRWFAIHFPGKRLNVTRDELEMAPVCPSCE